MKIESQENRGGSYKAPPLSKILLLKQPISIPTREIKFP